MTWSGRSPLGLIHQLPQGDHCVSGRSKSQFCFKFQCFFVFNDFGFTAIPEASRGLQKPPEASRSLSAGLMPLRCLVNKSRKALQPGSFQEPPGASRSLHEPPRASNRLSRSLQKPPEAF